MTVLEVYSDYPEVIKELKDMPYKNRFKAVQLFVLVFKAAEEKRKALYIFRFLLRKGIKSVDDFDRAKLLNLQQEKGIGPVYSRVLVNMFKIRLKEKCGSWKIAVPIDQVMEVGT